MRIDVKSMLADALKNKYALGAFNFVNMETLQGIVGGVKESGKPAIISVSEGAIKYMGFDYLTALSDAAKKESGNLVGLHLDHGTSFEICKAAIDNGFDSVMIDGSHLPFDENIKLTKSVVEYAAWFNVCVEGELGTLAGIEDNISVDKKNAFYTSPLEAFEFVQKTGVDSLAIAIGTSHGAFKFKGDAKLELEILKEIEMLLGEFPLVLHGASSINNDDIKMLNDFGGIVSGAKGVPPEILAYVAKEHNICKVNVDSDLRIAFTAALRKNFFENKEVFDIRKLLTPSKELIKQRVIEKIINLSN